MESAPDLILVVVVVTAAGGAARRWGWSMPLMLLVIGWLGSFLPRFEDFDLDPDVVLVGLLPPLLYAAAIRTSLIDFRSKLPAIASLSVGLVIATTLGVGAVAGWLLPISAAAALALGAVVAPPDAVAATTIARRIGLPRRVVTVLEGESLVNDATALVCLTAAITAIEGHITPAEITVDFAVSVIGGIAVGLLVALIVAKGQAHVADTVTLTAISLVTPFAAFLLAEEIHASGVLAVVIAGLILGHKADLLQSASARLFAQSNWSTITFLLEGVVFLLIGLEIRPIVDAVGTSDLTASRIALAALGVFVAVVVIRFAWVFATAWMLRRTNDPEALTTEETTVVSWAGMRGVVTLAAAFVLPPETPERDVLVLIALVVTAGTLVIEGTTLPLLIRRLAIPGPDRHEDALLAADVLERAGRAGRTRLDEELGAGTGVPAPEVVERLRRRGSERAEAMWERLGGEDETPSAAYARLRLAMLGAERDEVLRIRDTGRVPHEVLQEVLGALDVEESVLVLSAPDSTADRDEDLAAPVHPSKLCTHLTEAEATRPEPRSPEGCEECLRDGDTWVHLRLCLTCGHVGCCDSSPNRHADAHFHATDHPVIRSFEVGEAWRWCFVDEKLG
ncbi:Na+/H+ antiporter [Aquihabitans daechungensis]|uniref:Na+/H+ antiporter n=1 Tax=Aquihabitans daechungensis TaxID=1052257 RepID=UPI003B9EDADA